MSEPELQRSDCRHHLVFHDVSDALLGQTLFRIRNLGSSSERDRLQVLTLWNRTLEEVRHLLEVLSREAGVNLLTCLSTVAARQMADFSTKVWAHFLCDSDDYAMPDLD